MKYLLSIFFLLIVFSCNDKNADLNDSSEDFNWNLDELKKIVYLYNDTINNTIISDNNGLNDTLKFISSGNLIIEIKRNKISDIYKTEVEQKIISNKNRDTVIHNGAYVPYYDLDFDSGKGNKNTDFMGQVVFPSPNKKLKINESDTIRIQIPFPMIADLHVFGSNYLTFSEYQSYDNNDYALIRSEINISEIIKDERIDRTYDFVTKGKGAYYFDIENKRITASRIKIYSKIKTLKSKDSSRIGELFADDISISVMFKKIEE